MRTVHRSTYQRRWFPRLGERSPGISSRQERARARPSPSRDRRAIHPPHRSTSPFPASLTVPHTCTCRPTGSSFSCLEPSSLSFVFPFVSKEQASEAFLLRSILRGSRGLGQRPGQILIAVTAGLTARCPPGQYQGPHRRQLRRLTVRDPGRQIDRYAVRSPRASPVSRYTISVE